MSRWMRLRSRRTVFGLAAVLAVVLVAFAVALAGSVGGQGASSGAPPMSGTTRAGGGSAPEAADSAAAPLVAERGSMPAQGVAVGAVGPDVVRTAQVTLEVDEPAVSVRDVRLAATAAGGYVAEEQSGRNSGWVVIRVPADGLDRLIDQVATLGMVTERSTTVADVTEQVVDLDARVVTQQASVDRVRALLAQATSIGDIVAIEAELAQREAELDSLTSRLAALRDQVELSTLTVDLRSVGGPGDDDERPAAGFLDGLGAGWNGLVALGTATGAVIGFVLPFLPVLALLAGVVWLAVRIVRGRRTPAVAGAGGRSGPGSEGES